PVVILQLIEQIYWSSATNQHAYAVKLFAVLNDLGDQGFERCQSNTSRRDDQILGGRRGYRLSYGPTRAERTTQSQGHANSAPLDRLRYRTYGANRMLK